MGIPAKRQWSWLPSFAVCCVVATVVLIPLLATLLGGLRTNGELLTEPFSIPKTLHWENFGLVLASDSPFWGEIVNSLVTVTGTVVLLLFAACPAAFVLARISFRGREVVFNFFLFGLLFPLTVAVLPLYITIRQFGLLDSLWGVILPQAAFGLPITILILRNFFRAIPIELEDAATIDGASKPIFFWRVLLPLARPAIAVVSILAVVSSWNNFLLPLLVLTDQSQWTLPIGATQFQQQYATDWPSILAFVTLAMIPAILIYLLAERQIVAGLTAGAVKG
ncbi:MAG TPA: carbohydrate ABC transporter permease, partial [Ktedonobacteraceae bacterium]|nr:carbohydrate ABC transporter permease [Ktedonobacteraceae bacterium]